MQAHDIVIFPKAEEDLDDIVSYLSGFYQSTALRQYDRIVEAIESLAVFPKKHERYMNGLFRLDYRKMVIDDYLVFYVVTSSTVEIHRILNGKRQIGRLLE